MGQRREGGSPLGLNQILQHKAAHPLGLKGHALGFGAFHQRDVQLAAIRKFHRGLYPVVVVGEICPLGDAQLIQQYFSDHGHQFMAMSSGKVNSTVSAALGSRLMPQLW